MGVNSESVTDARVPHISLVFREMWGTTNLDRNFLLGVKACGARAVVSHISRKTSEMWGTRCRLLVRSSNEDSFKHLAHQEQGRSGRSGQIRQFAQARWDVGRIGARSIADRHARHGCRKPSVQQGRRDLPKVLPWHVDRKGSVCRQGTGPKVRLGHRSCSMVPAQDNQPGRHPAIGERSFQKGRRG
jgi:hypothetical protein